MNLGARQSSINNGVSGLILCFLISCIVLLIYCLHLYIFKECFENSKTFWDNAPARHVDKAARPFQKSEPLSKDDVIWFLHVSDIHISKLSSRSSDHFLSFVDNILPTVNPSFVLATGDLTDGKFKGTIKTGQVLEEWKFYYDTLMSRKINSSRWIDLPGNHDKFDVADHRKNFYSLFGLQANYDQILHTVSTRIGDINILSLDASPLPGLGRPLNFFGHLDRPYMDRLEKALNSPKIQNSDPLKTIAICHYPLCTMTFSQSSLGTPFSTLTKKISLYLSGHLHNLIFGLGDDLTTIHNTGFTEIEVGDLQAHKQFNLYSMTSRNTFSWSSHTIEDKILLHVISPKSSRFVLTDRESNWIGRDENGNLLVDLLLFPVQNTSISHLTITIDGNSKTIQSHEITLPFFTYSFEGTRNINSEQSHALLVTAVLDDNSTVSMGHSFSLCFENGFIYDTVGSKIMSFPFVSFFKALYWISYSLVLLFFGAFIYFLIPHGHGMKKVSCLCVLYIFLAISPISPLLIGKFITDIPYLQMIFFMGMLNLDPNGFRWSFMADFPIFYSVYWSSFVAPLVMLLMLEYLFSDSVILKLLKFVTLAIGACLLALIFLNYGFLSIVVSPGISWIFFLLLIFSISGLHVPKVTEAKEIHSE